MFELKLSGIQNILKCSLKELQKNEIIKMETSFISALNQPMIRDQLYQIIESKHIQNLPKLVKVCSISYQKFVIHIYQKSMFFYLTQEGRNINT